MSGRIRRAAAAGLLAIGATGPAARGGVITLAAGTGTGATADVTFVFAYDGPVAIDRVTGATGTVEAGTAGGRTLFSGGGVPVVLPADGGAYVAGGSAPADRTGKADGLSPVAPDAGGAVPTGAARLTLDVSEAGLLTAVLSDASGDKLGAGEVPVPDGGWWVLGLAPDASPVPIPEPVPSPAEPTPPVVDPTEPTEPQPTSPTDPGSPADPTSPPVATPEPSAAALAAIGAAAAGGWRRLARRRASA